MTEKYIGCLINLYGPLLISIVPFRTSGATFTFSLKIIIAHSAGTDTRISNKEKSILSNKNIFPEKIINATNKN